MDEIVIRRLIDVTDLCEIQEIEKRVWETNNPIPLHHTKTSVLNGGVVLGAFANGRMAGFVYSFPGFVAKQNYLCLHTLAVLPEWRNRGIGVLLCHSLAKTAKTSGYSLLTWTYDPLETANAFLYIAKLGAVCSTYLTNCYGEMQDALNKGLETDRLKLAWWLTRPVILPKNKSMKTTYLCCPDLRLRPASVNKAALQDKQAIAAIAVPNDFQSLKQADFALAKKWRIVTREAFTECFAQGWCITGFRCKDSCCCEYLLTYREELFPREPWLQEVKEFSD